MQVPQPLVDTIARRRSFAIVGAGFSKNAVLPPPKTMPDWDEMTRLLNRDLRKPFWLSDDLTPSKKASLYRQVASRFEIEHSRPSLLAKLEQILHSGRAQPGKAHIALARLPFEFVYTTNFDNLLEKSYELVDKRYRVVSMEETLALLGGPEETTIIKMHGDLASGNVVITERDRKSYKAHHDAILTHLTSLMLTHTPLIVGYSLRDPHLTNVRRYVKRRLKRFQRMSYYTKLNCTSHEFEKALKKRIHIVSMNEMELALPPDDLFASFFDVIRSGVDDLRDDDTREQTPEFLGSADDLDGGSESFVFVVQPGNPKREDDSKLAANWAIAPTMQQFGMKTIKTTDAPSIDDLTVEERIRWAIRQSTLCVFDVSKSTDRTRYSLRTAKQFLKPVMLVLNSEYKDEPKVKKLLKKNRNFPLVVYDISDLERMNEDIRNVLRNTFGNHVTREIENHIIQEYYDTAIVRCWMALELQIRKLSVSYGIKPEIPQLRPNLLRNLIRDLVHMDVLEHSDYEILEHFRQRRNQVMHGVTKPSESLARHMLRYLEEFQMRYPLYSE